MNTTRFKLTAAAVIAAAGLALAGCGAAQDQPAPAAEPVATTVSETLAPPTAPASDAAVEARLLTLAELDRAGWVRSRIIEDEVAKEQAGDLSDKCGNGRAPVKPAARAIRAYADHPDMTKAYDAAVLAGVTYGSVTEAEQVMGWARESIQDGCTYKEGGQTFTVSTAAPPSSMPDAVVQRVTGTAGPGSTTVTMRHGNTVVRALTITTTGGTYEAERIAEKQLAKLRSA